MIYRESSVFYYGDGKALLDEQDCLAVVYIGEMRYRVFFFPMVGRYTIKVDGTVYDAGSDPLKDGRNL